MKKLRFLPFILALSLPITGCDFFKKSGGSTDPGSGDSEPSGGGDSDPSGGGGDPGDIDTEFNALKNSIIQNHNYTFEVESYYKNYPEERFDGVYYNLDNNVFYGTDPEFPNLWVRGYTKVKDQGVALFYKGLQSDQVVIEEFVSTNSALNIYDIDGEVLEYIFEEPMTRVEADHYRISKQDIVGIVGTYSGLELSYISNPEYIDIVRDGNSILITSILTANYYDPETLNPVENEPVYVGLKVKDIGTTQNALLTEFAKAESSKKPRVTAWDDTILGYFEEHYAGFVPPFINGLGYAFYHDCQWNGYEQRYDIMGQDFTSGDKRLSYGQQLEGVGFVKQAAGYYEKIESLQEGLIVRRYRVEMDYVDPSEPHRGKTYGYWYPQGNFQITFYMLTELVQSVDTVAKVNSYIETTKAASIAPKLPETGPFATCDVTNFEDHTEIANQLGGDWLFLTSTSGYFRVYIPNYEDAVDFYTEFLANCADKGFNHVETSQAIPLTFITDFADSKIIMDNINMFSKTAYEKLGFVQLQYGIRNNYSQTFTFDIEKDAGVDSIHRISPTNYFIAPDTKVTFSFDLKQGYEFDKLECADSSIEFTKESGTNTYSFTMPSSNVSVKIKTKTAAKDIEFEKEYFVYINNDDKTESMERPNGHTSHLLSMTFHKDGTMTYKRTRYTPSGGVHSGPFSMKVNFTLINGSFMFYYTQGDNSDFDKWRLFSSNVEGTYNETGTFADGVITVQVCDKDVNISTIHLQLAE